MQNPNLTEFLKERVKPLLPQGGGVLLAEKIGKKKSVVGAILNKGKTSVFFSADTERKLAEEAIKLLLPVVDVINDYHKHFSISTKVEGEGKLTKQMYPS